MKATIDDLITQLKEFKSHSTDLDAVKAQHTALSSDLSTMTEALASTKAELASAQSGLSAVQIKNLKQYQSDIFARTKELESLNAAVRDAKTRLDTHKVEIESAAAKHQQIEDSISSLRQRLG